MWRYIPRAGLGLLLCSLAAPLLAQTERSSGGGANQRIVQQYQQLAAEKTALEAQVATLKHDVDTAHAELAAVKKERDSLKSGSTAVRAIQANLSEVTAAKQAAEKSAEQTKASLNELVARFRQTANDLKQVETDRQHLQGELRERSAAYDKCAADNLSLYEINSDLLNRYEHVGLFTRVTANEPFTGITRNRIENLVDGYRARALELREKSDTTAGGAKGGTKSSPRP